MSCRKMRLRLRTNGREDSEALQHVSSCDRCIRHLAKMAKRQRESEFSLGAATLCGTCGQPKYRGQSCQNSECASIAHFGPTHGIRDEAVYRDRGRPVHLDDCDEQGGPCQACGKYVCFEDTECPFCETDEPHALTGVR